MWHHRTAIVDQNKGKEKGEDKIRKSWNGKERGVEWVTTGDGFVPVDRDSGATGGNGSGK